jgi:predicted aldo/keto reductase-like oxidoreductase
MHRRSLERFDFDSVLMPWNWYAAKHEAYAPDFAATRAICKKRNIAVQTIKAIARGPWAAGATRDHSTWYQPLENELDIRNAMHWVLSEPEVFLNSAGDVGLLPSVLRAAQEHGSESAPNDAVMADLSERTGLASIFGI